MTLTHELSRRLQAAQDRLQELIDETFGAAEWAKLPIIKEVDSRMLSTEKRDLMSPEADEWGPLPYPMESKIVPAE